MTGPQRMLAWTVATWFGCGRVPRAPGTAGALGAIPVYLVAARWGRPGVSAAALVITSLGIWASSYVARELGKKDPQLVVVDEVAGMLVTLAPVRVVSWRAIVVAFVLFRLFDVVKPWPVRSFEKLPGGWGIVLDDIVAGGIGAAAMALLGAAGALP